MTKEQVKEIILKEANEKYRGSLRFIRHKLIIKLVGKEGLNLIYNSLEESLHEPLSLALFCFVNDIPKRPKCPCGNPLKFNTTKKEFAKYCSRKCRNENFDEVLEKIKKTNKEKYGAENVFAAKEIKEKIKETNLEKYGVENYTQTEEYQKRAKNRHVSDLTRKKMSQTSLKSFYDTLSSKFATVKPLFTFEEYKGVSGYKKYKWYCTECKKSFIAPFNCGGSPICTHCKPKGTKHEVLVKQFLNDHEIEYIFRWRGLPSGKEIDIYIPSHNMGIEICGLYWHRHDALLDKNYHLSKLEECEKQGIQLITIFDDEFFEKKDIVFARLKHKLGLVKRKIHARKCEVKEIDTKTSYKFLNKYHIQGAIGGMHKLGLFYKNRLVAVMTFNKGRMATSQPNKENVFELGRYCSLFNFSIVGGLNKLLHYFLKKYNPKEVYSYCDRRWNNGNGYFKMGMSLVRNTAPNYTYTDNFMHRHNRILFQKHKLKSWDCYSDDLTEEQIMLKNEFHKIYDCGSKLFALNCC